MSFRHCTAPSTKGTSHLICERLSSRILCTLNTCIDTRHHRASCLLTLYLVHIHTCALPATVLRWQEQDAKGPKQFLQRHANNKCRASRQVAFRDLVSQYHASKRPKRRKHLSIARPQWLSLPLHPLQESAKVEFLFVLALVPQFADFIEESLLPLFSQVTLGIHRIILADA